MEIGGRPVLERWLRERAGRRLSREEIETFRKIATALERTLPLQREIDRLYRTIDEDFISFGA